MGHSDVITYLKDHLAGSVVAIELLEMFVEHRGGEPVGRMAREVLAQVSEDRAVLEEMLQRFDPEHASNVFKEAVAWAGQKLTLMKLGAGLDSDPGALEALEMLTLGINGKLGLWEGIIALPQRPAAWRDIDCDGLAQRARAQLALVEQHRIDAAKALFSGADD